MTSTNTKVRSLASKLVTVMSTVNKLSKTGHNDYHNYDYVTEADVLEAVRDELIKNNVFVFSSVVGAVRENDITTVRVKYTFVDGDTGESKEVEAVGQGADKQDKGVYKALTGASKYFFMKNFLIPTGDDPENEKKTEAAKAAAPKTVAAKQPAINTSAASDFKPNVEFKKPTSKTNGSVATNGSTEGKWE